ncbi:putative bifunctional diguanylate cyclase/phosphodiesterase [Sphingomonas xinjiangensis]|uniref:EAL domain-containing protein (Putative c-di-GMP-specific phosphodiesterase class I)/GGDEF domain-containing protein/DNA-binding NarL/FixJ family response regulator n=1 Tax=Sphingomonas xinjiangensis TaxID=643568 RepID=A0A840Y7X7_9SPHN|nr:GGDEF domain-containing phosphodiesterase [Sphingomonas xinjiangensis]MBB5708964.1 EAL domain-containing protein (putative c-di-GMP-specific phosphodiesterase class I)/GGDEF domain-containing protein/DNA-binding NarL/FixJ family response regulator [Sphingomonas xinjiangensis]
MEDSFTVVANEPSDSEVPVFILSFRQRDEVAAAAASGGWRVIAARRAEGVDQRFLASGAAVAVVDARGAMSEGLAAAKALGPTIEQHGAAMLILISQSDTVHMRHFYDAGATHFLSSPMSSAAMAHAIRFAFRHAERLTGWGKDGGGAAEPLGWRFDPEIGAPQLTPALANLLGLTEAPGLRAMLRRLEAPDRLLLRAALRRLRRTGGSTAFAHDLPGVGRMVQHLQHDPDTGRLDVLVEALGVAPDASSAVRDLLTGARDGPSARRWIDRRLGEGAGLAVVLIGMSRFDTVNTAYGRDVGDELLRAVSKRVSEVSREALGGSAIIARIAGSEFLVATDMAAGARLEQGVVRLEEALGRPFVVRGAITPIGARLATAVSEAGDSAATILRRASEALLGKEVRGDPAGPPVEQLANELHRALERGEITIRYQPQVEIASGKIIGVEALARWNHPELGEIGAEALFAAAERAGLEAALSDTIQRRALSGSAQWPSLLSGLRLSVNVTAADVGRAGFVESLLGRVDASGFPRSRLTVEITETGIMADLTEAARLLSELRAAGCRVAIDDFGTGYSSLAYLKALPLDYLKIDKRLSHDITGSHRDRVVVRGVIDMARSLGLSVVAEGVETEAQLDLLAKEGCQYFQGYLCSEPLDVPALAQLVQA